VARLLYLSAAGPDDSDRAALPFLLAIGAAEAGHEANVCLLDAAISLLQDEVARTTIPAHWPRLRELIATAVTLGVLIHVAQRGARPDGIDERDLMSKNARFLTYRNLADLCLDVDRVISV